MFNIHVPGVTKGNSYSYEYKEALDFRGNIDVNMAKLWKTFKKKGNVYSKQENIAFFMLL